MLAALSIRDIVLIERLDLAFEQGLSVLTGETGAGKSILLDAMSLALGGRGDGGLVRQGQAQGSVRAAFDVPAAHPAHDLVRSNDIHSDGEIVLRRVQTADGRTRAFVNDQPVSVNLLKAIGGALVEIHGQHVERALVDPATHRALLDAFAGLEPRAREAASRHSAWRQARRDAAAQRERIAKAAGEAEYLRHVLEELTDLKPEPGEEALLAERRADMMAAEKIAGDLTDADEVLGGHGSPTPALSGLLRRLERKASGTPELIRPVVEPLARALDAIDEARSAVEAALRLSAFDPKELERIEERLFSLRGAARKHNVPVDELAGLAERVQRDLAEVDAGEERLAALEALEAEARRAYEGTALELSALRRGAALELDRAVGAELAPLKLERARFETIVESASPAEGGPEGVDRVEFWVQTNPGTRPGPMMRVASGGELSRFLLALKVVLADRGSAPALVFDEIDTGVGGAVAEAIGTRLARLGERVQVLSVTHAPQVAARAGTHYLIAKEGGEAGVATRVRRLDARERREEIARMLAGARITDEARAAAEQLMAGGV